MPNYAFVLDGEKKPLSPCHPAVAKKLLKEQKAAVFRMYPFTIILKKVVEVVDTESVQLKIDPGSKTTGLALVQGNKVVWGGELEHRGSLISKRLQNRAMIRRKRRNRKTRYRQPRFLNRIRSKSKGWLAPSLLHRVLATKTWVNRLRKFVPITGISMELVRFDTQKIDNPEISGTEYQQGELAGYEVRQYLLEKWNYQCAYCRVKNVPFEVEHISPKSRGGSDRVSNLCISCRTCNLKKGNKTAEEFGHPEIQKKANTPMKDAAAVNSTRWKLFESLKLTGLPVEVSSAGRTKWNRNRLGLEKTHWIDAACVGELDDLVIKNNKPLYIKCTGHGNRQMCRTDKFGFPRMHKTRCNVHFGFQTGDIVKAIVKKGKRSGIHIGRVACRVSGKFDINTKHVLIRSISYKNCQVLHCKDGYIL